ncbi:MAG: PTS transporter subunit EIIC [Lactovum sp.]
MNINDNVSQIIELVGGVDNITKIAHCFTRLRFNLKDRKLVKDEELEALDYVMGLIDAGGQVQVVIGNSVSKYYEAAIQSYPLLAGGEVELEADETVKLSFVDKITDLASALFVPILGVLAASGTLQGLTSLLLLMGAIDEKSGTYLVLHAIGESIFYYLPVFLAYTSAQKFGGKPFFAMIIAGVMIYPELITAVDAGEALTFVGIPMTLINYSKTVFPIVLSSYLAAKVEKLARKIIPDILQMILVPLMVFLVVVPLALLVVGPVLTYAMSLVTSSVIACYKFSPLLTGTLVGGIWQLLVLFGISKAFIPIFAANFASLQFDPFVPIVFFSSVMGQTGAVLGFSLRSKSNKIKQVGFASGISGFFGITEPALFGINVPARKPFLFGLLSGAVGGFICSILGAKGYTFGSGILGIPVLISAKGLDMAFYGAIIASLASLALSFALTYFFGWSQDIEDKLLKVDKKAVKS